MIAEKIINRILHPFKNNRKYASLPVTKDTLINAVEELRIDLIRQQIAIKWSIIDNFRRDERFLSGRKRQCPLCNYEDSEERFTLYETHCIFGGGELIRFQCPSCDLIFGDDKIFRLSDAELSKEYELHYKVYAEGDSTPQELRSFHALNPSKKGVYLNYGAGSWSNSVQILRDEGWLVYAYEPHASAHPGGPHFISDKSKLSTMKFDGLFSNNLLEHLKKPIDEIVFMRSLLKPDALMSHATPCFDYLHEYTRFHLYFYLGKSKEVLANKAGLFMYDFIKDGEFMNVIYKLEQ